MNVAIVGAGKLGFKIAEALAGGDYSITVIEKDGEVLQKLSQQFDVMSINGDAKDVNVLRDIKIGTFDYLLALTDNDEANIVISSFAKKLGCKHEVRIASDWRCKMAVILECKSEVAIALCAVKGLFHRSQHNRAYDIFIRLSFQCTQNVIQSLRMDAVWIARQVDAKAGQECLQLHYFLRIRPFMSWHTSGVMLWK